MNESTMTINPQEITIRELVADFKDDGENGVWGFGGKLNIRPPYQREFVYKEKQKKAVIETIMSGFPLNVMYWSVNGDGTYEIIDGQQRTMSICEYYTTNKSFGYKIGGFEHGFQNLSDEDKNKFLNYTLTIYFCEGTSNEKLDWFQIINTAGEQLTPQELKNAVFSGSWVTDAKRHFSKKDCVAVGLGGKYVKPHYEVNRQGLFELVLLWKTGSMDGLKGYMRIHQHDQNANELWEYFKRVIHWVETTFPKYRKEMKGVDWGFLYGKYKDGQYDTAKLEEEITRLMMDEDVTNKKGIYRYVLTRDERSLNIRTFSDNVKREVYERQGGRCHYCGKPFDISDMEGDHITPWSRGGKTVVENCRMACRRCNKEFSNK